MGLLKAFFSVTQKRSGAKKAVQLSTVENEFKELLTCYKGGLAVDSLEDLYEIHFERSLPLEAHGVRSTAELICKILNTLDLTSNSKCFDMFDTKATFVLGNFLSKLDEWRV